MPDDELDNPSEIAHKGSWWKATNAETGEPQPRTRFREGLSSSPLSDPASGLPVGSINRSDLGFRSEEQEVEACPEPGCALLIHHRGLHMGLDGAEFSKEQETLCVCQGEEPSVGSIASVISSMLLTPPLPGNEVQLIMLADLLFGRLDQRLRAGEEPPFSWNVLGAEDEEGRQFVTKRYDALSENLRMGSSPGKLVESGRHLEKAGVEWRQLLQAMEVGSAMPEPWWRSVPRPVEGAGLGRPSPGRRVD
ncbi:hypothetical protein IDM40_18700 [Nocardiopsis sp. HNM0947]|uniref:Uncharacterized protein n=1 Tax=Nocardiopsis coralli TaxID=2772213 RepID=A0ABR9PAJ5_9ACTN|nr:hypothetical protein [Nocardiopsis coralli]MBE3000710.1 hypothetical protein [Nocardiopsis coralli]